MPSVSKVGDRVKSLSKLLVVLIAVGCFATSGRAQESQQSMALDDAITGYESAAHQSFQGVVTDWTSHHVIFSKPEPGSDAEDKVQQDPRYWLQQIRRSLPESEASVANDVQTDDSVAGGYSSDKKKKKNNNKKKQKIALVKDWNVPLGVAGKLAADNYPSKFGSGTCSDFVVYPTGLAGVAGGQATIVAYNNLYAGTCTTGSVPSVFWAYNTGVGATVVTSPVFSKDGSQVAFVQSTLSVASLVLLKFTSSGGGPITATAPTIETFGTYRACAAPCMTVNALSGNPNDLTSSPFYDATTDSIYVGDSAGSLHKFTNVFLGTPAEVTGGGSASGWPQAMGTTALKSPVYDTGGSGKVFVTDAGGFLYSIPAGGGSANKITSGRIGFGTVGIADGPVLDPSTEKLYVFVGDDGANGGVFQFATGFAATTTGIEEVLGSEAAATVIYDGTFDNTYYTGAGITGNLYVCGYHTGGTEPRLFQINMNSTFSGAVNTYNTPSTGAGTCSPVTEIFNSPHDWIFLSTTANGTGTGCTGACIYNFNVQGAGATGTTTAGLASPGGTSGIVIDNVLTGAGQSQIYYSASANKATTTINHTGGYSNVATSIVVASGAGIANNDYLIIGLEILQVTAGGGTTTLTVVRGQLGTSGATITNAEAVTDNGAAVQTSQSTL